MFSKKTFLLLLLIVLSLAAIKFFFLSNNDSAKPAGKPGMNSAPVGVTAFVVKSSKLENKIFISGSVIANEEAQLVAETSGKIISMNLVEGSTVNKGDLLVKINDTDLQAQLKKLKAQEELETGKESRQQKLLEINGISKEEHETSLNNINSIHADVEFIRAQIAKTEIRAPFSGNVGLKNISEGNFVSSSMNIASIQQIDPVKIDFSVPEKYASLIQKGNTIRFSTEQAKEMFEAKIIAVESKIDISTRTVKARAICPNKNGKIIPGSFAKIELILNESENSLMIPTEALIPVLKGYKVFVCRNGKADEAKVITGLRTEKTVQIIEGIQQGDTVITTGIMQLKKDAPVKIISLQ